jgi:hypothetical protein
MRNDPAPDEALLQRLPLPLAQLYRRAHNTKTPLDRHRAAYYLCEATLKLLGSAAVAVGDGDTLAPPEVGGQNGTRTGVPGDHRRPSRPPRPSRRTRVSRHG